MPIRLGIVDEEPIHHIIDIIIRSKFFFLFIGREPSTWPANNCLQIMVCSCAMPSNSVWLQIIFCSCVKETVLFSFLRSLLRENGWSLCFPRIFIKKTNSVIEWLNNYWTRFLQNIVICQCLSRSIINNCSAGHRQITIFCLTSSSNRNPVIVIVFIMYSYCWEKFYVDHSWN